MSSYNRGAPAAGAAAGVGAAPSGRRDKDWQELMDAMHEVSSILNTGLDKQTLAILVNLCEAGVNPEALALIVQELRKEAASRRKTQQQHPDAHRGSSSYQN